MANEDKPNPAPRGVLNNTELIKLLQMNDDDNQKSCWVCFGTEADDRLAAWVQPCKCIGTTKWPPITSNSSNNELPISMDIADESPIVVGQINGGPGDINQVPQGIINQSASGQSQNFDNNNPHTNRSMSSLLRRLLTNESRENENNEDIQMALAENTMLLFDKHHKLEIEKAKENISQQREKHILEMRKLELEIEILNIKRNNSVHQSCLQRWVDEKQRDNISRKVLCPQCKAEYIVVFPSMGAFVALLDVLEGITHKISPFIAGGVLLGSIYWIAITYGAVTVMQVVGHKEGLEMMESADPLVLLVLLPTIPVTLISAKMYNWEDSVLFFLRKYCAKIPALAYILPFGNVNSDRSAIVSGQSSNSNQNLNTRLSPTRIFCSALLLPTISTIIGKIFFRSIQNNLHRTFLGGLTYITIKGALKIYHKQMLYIRHSSRKILDYTESNLKLYRNTGPPTNADAVSTSRDDSEQVV